MNKHKVNGIDMFFDTDRTTLRSLTKVCEKSFNKFSEFTGITSRYDLDRKCVELHWDTVEMTTHELVKALEAVRGMGENITKALKIAVQIKATYTGSEFYLVDCDHAMLRADMDAMFAE
jgi:hypothetical protein